MDEGPAILSGEAGVGVLARWSALVPPGAPELRFVGRLSSTDAGQSLVRCDLVGRGALRKYITSGLCVGQTFLKDSDAANCHIR